MPAILRYMTDARNFKSMSRLSLALVAIFSVVPALLVNTGSAHAQKFAIAAQIGTTGLGGGAVIGVAPRINFRSMFGFFPTSPSVNIEDIDFATDLPSFLLTTVDLYLTGAIHLSGGGLLVTNDGNIGVVGTFDGVEVDFGGMPFTGGPDDRLVGPPSSRLETCSGSPWPLLWRRGSYSSLVTPFADLDEVMTISLLRLHKLLQRGI